MVETFFLCINCNTLVLRIFIKLYFIKKKRLYRYVRHWLIQTNIQQSHSHRINKIIYPLTPPTMQMISSHCGDADSQYIATTPLQLPLLFTLLSMNRSNIYTRRTSALHMIHNTIQVHACQSWTHTIYGQPFIPWQCLYHSLPSTLKYMGCIELAMCAQHNTCTTKPSLFSITHRPQVISETVHAMYNLELVTPLKRSVHR